MYSSFVLGVLCLVGLATGQITPSPSTRVPVGYNLTIECDSGTGSLTPSLRIDSNPTSTNPRVELVSSSSGVRVFRFISVARNDSGLVFSCTNVQGQFTLEVLYMPEILSSINDVTANEGESANVTFTFDANPTVTVENITVTVGGQSVEFNPSVNGNMVSITLLNLATTGQYMVTIANTVGSDSATFQVNILTATPTSEVQPMASTTIMSSSSSSSSSSSGSSTMTRSSSATPTPTQEPAGPNNSATGVQASIVSLSLLLILIVFLVY